MSNNNNCQQYYNGLICNGLMDSKIFKLGKFSPFSLSHF